MALESVAVMQDQRRILSGLLEGVGFNGADFEVEACDAGANNRVLAVTVGRQTFAAKWYVDSVEDNRDRLNTEWNFLNYAKTLEIDCVPTPLSRNTAANVALYDFIEGSKIEPRAVTGRDVNQAIDFFCALNDPVALSRLDDQMVPLPNASEACFSIADYFHLLDGRLERLEVIVPDNDIDRAACVLVAELKQQWGVVKQGIVERCDHLGLSPELELAQAERCISPSDFGFHNAIKKTDGVLSFIDFEYAGWDDPAKMISDFFFQPAVPVSHEYYDCFVEAVMSSIPNSEAARARIDLLRPVFGLKWCCIMLNIFIPQWANRRAFAHTKAGLDELKARQLSKAEDALRRLQSLCAQFTVSL